MYYKNGYIIKHFPARRPASLKNLKPAKTKKKVSDK